MTLQIGIIGGGLSGTLVALKILQHFSNVEVTLFEKVPAQVCRGIAYSSSVGFQPLNVRAYQMNLWANKPGDFYKWIQNSSDRYFKDIPAADEFIKREIFGDYLEETFKKITAGLKPTQSLKIITEEVCRIENESHGLKLFTTESQVKVDYAVLALGNFLPGDIPIKNSDFYKSSLYQGNPWNRQWTKALKSSDDILFLGSGLTTIDQVINLVNDGHEGTIYIMSRRGFLPQPHRRYNAMEIPTLPVYLGITALEVFRLVRAQLKQFASEERDWRNVIDHIRTQVPQIWSYLPMEERKGFLRHIRPFWEIHRHRIPEVSHEIIQENIMSEKIKVLAGRLTDIIQEQNRAKVLLRVRGKQEEKILAVDKVVNCTGPQTDFRKIDQPLIQNLKEKGWLKTDELKLGLEVNAEGQLIGESGQVIQNIFAIGSLKKAVMWECTALREISLQADQLVRKLNSQFVSL
jgi:uncharacterized NAD(P)/FAD-binding protein YdhS